jgi:hypothetical protein
MIIKQADDHTDELARLEQWSQSADRSVAKLAETELRNRRAGVNGEARSAYFIDFDFGKTPNWVVIHDLRLEHAGRTAQIDHLLIGRTLDCYVLESKHFHAGVRITDQGEFLRWNDFKHSYEGMPSPLEQNNRHIAVLRDVMATLPLPVRLGFRLNPEFQSLVLVSPSARIDRPKAFDTAAVIKADQLKTRLMAGIDNENPLISMRRAAKLVSCETLHEVAKLLVRQHRAVQWPLPPGLEKATEAAHAPNDQAIAQPSSRVADEAVAAVPAPSQTSGDAPSCKNCHGRDGSIQYGQYGYYFRCVPCGVNTAIRFTCLSGHHPRLRKAKLQFFRDCPECGSSELYFTNPAARE